MSQFKIVDIDFCESELPLHKGVKGGGSITTPHASASWSSSAASDSNYGYYNSYFYDPITGKYGAVAAAGYNGAAAGAAAGAASDGSTSVGTSVTVSVG